MQLHADESQYRQKHHGHGIFPDLVYLRAFYVMAECAQSPIGYEELSRNQEHSSILLSHRLPKFGGECYPDWYGLREGIKPRRKFVFAANEL